MAVAAVSSDAAVFDVAKVLVLLMLMLPIATSSGPLHKQLVERNTVARMCYTHLIHFFTGNKFPALRILLLFGHEDAHLC